LQKDIAEGLTSIVSPKAELPALKQNSKLSGVDNVCSQREQVITIELTGFNVGVLVLRNV
jgi:hypothetical protein